MSASSRGRNGVLPINPAIMKKPSTTPANSKGPPKAAAPKLRLIVRRLPPGLTESEFWSCIGEEWKIGAGKVDSAVYKEGKVSKDPSKPSKPARAYLKVKELPSIDMLSAKVKQTSFQDAKNTAKDPCLLGPPSLEFAPFNKISGSRVRHDGRQGTIDQDQEFIDFLQSLTEPITKPSTNGSEGVDMKHGAVTTTPLIQFIKEKKAAKAKDAALAKSAKGRQEAKETKAAKADSKPTIVVKNPASAAEKARVAKATQETVKAINKSVAAMVGKTGTPKPESKTPAAKDTTASQPPPKRERERGSASAAARILQRDLGLTPKEPKTARILRNPGPHADGDATPKVKLPPTTSSSNSSQPQAQSKTQTQAPAQANPPTGPRNVRAASTASAKPTPPPPPQRNSKPTTQPSAGAKSAFLKHANASQGITEDLLRTAFEAFGVLTKCEIDKKKGFGYIDFTDPDALKKAMDSSPVKVGNGQVVVLENKSKPQAKTAPPAVSANPSPVQTQVRPQSRASATDTSVVATATPPKSISPIETEPPSEVIPPTAPKGTTRGGQNGSRGNRGSNFAPGRGNFAAGNRGSSRGFKGAGRGAQSSHQHRAGGRGGSAAAAPAAGAATGSPQSPAPVANGAGDNK